MLDGMLTFMLYSKTAILKILHLFYKAVYSVELKINFIANFHHVHTKLMQLDIGSNSYPYFQYSFPRHLLKLAATEISSPHSRLSNI